LNFVSWLNRPAEIRDSEISAIRNFLDEHMNIQVQPIDISIDDQIRILNGPFSMYEGKITALDSNKVKLYLPSLGYMMVVEVDRSNIQVIQTAMRRERRASSRTSNKIY
jgi:transcription antitermination factor NusG